MSFATRQMGNLVKPNLMISAGADGVISMKAESTFKTTAISFKLNEEFDEETTDGRKTKVSFTNAHVFSSLFIKSGVSYCIFLSFPSLYLLLRMASLCRNRCGTERQPH